VDKQNTIGFQDRLLSNYFSHGFLLFYMISVILLVVSLVIWGIELRALHFLLGKPSCP
jgi:hypothetical protein